MSERWGDYEIVQADTTIGQSKEAVTKYTYRDSLISIAWVVIPNQIMFSLENLTDHTMKINWNAAAFIDLRGASHGVMHSGVRYVDRNKPQAPSVVPAHSTITDIIVPKDHVRYRGQLGWMTDPLVQPYVLNSEIERQAALGNEGKSISVLLPLEVEGVVNEYTFVFEVQDVTLPTAQAE